MRQKSATEARPRMSLSTGKRTRRRRAEITFAAALAVAAATLFAADEDCAEYELILFPQESPTGGPSSVSETPRSGLIGDPSEPAVIDLAAAAGDLARGTVWFAISAEGLTGESGDPRGAQFWSLALVVTGDFHLVDATTAGTAGDSAPEGLRDEGFEYTELIDLEANPPLDGAAEPAGSTGVVSAVVLSYRTDVTLPATGTATVLRLDVESVNPRGERELTGEIRCRDGLRGSGLPISNEIVSDDRGLAFCSCQRLRLEVSPAPGGDGPGEGFVRGDANGSGLVDMADAITVVEWLFGRPDDPPCREAVDANASGELDLSDAIYLLDYLFDSKGPPPAPFPECGLPREPEGCREGSCEV